MSIRSRRERLASGDPLQMGLGIIQPNLLPGSSTGKPHLRVLALEIESADQKGLKTGRKEKHGRTEELLNRDGKGAFPIVAGDVLLP